MTRLNINDARCEALFASWLQRSDSPTADRVAEAISRAVRQFGIRGCAGQMAQRVRRPPRGGRRPHALGPPARRRDRPAGEPRSRAAWPIPGAGHRQAMTQRAERGGDERDV